MTRFTLLRDRDFRLWWSAATISNFGTGIDSSVAFPLLAVLTLGATPFQMGLLESASMAAFLVIGLPVGAWVDRLRRRPIMIGADLGRAVLLATVPLAWWFGVLTLPQLIVVAALVGALTVFFDVSAQSYLPTLVGRSRLGDGNAALQASQSTARVSAPALGGLLVQAIGAAPTVLADAISYLGSALALSRIRVREERPARTDRRLRADIAEGLRFVFGNPSLRAITLCTATSNLFGGILSALDVLFLARELRLSPATVGLVVAVGGLGGVLGALTSGWWHRHIGQARSIWAAALTIVPGALLIPFAGAGLGVWAAAAGDVVFGYGVVVYNVAQVSYRQAICPDRLLGRMNASIRFLVWGVLPFGGIAGGALAEQVGIRPALWISGLGVLLAVGWLLGSPLIRLRDLPAEPAPEAPEV